MFEIFKMALPALVSLTILGAAVVLMGCMPPKLTLVGLRLTTGAVWAWPGITRIVIKPNKISNLLAVKGHMYGLRYTFYKLKKSGNSTTIHRIRWIRNRRSRPANCSRGCEASFHSATYQEQQQGLRRPSYHFENLS